MSNNSTTPARGKVPFGQKAAFGAGHLVLNLLPGSLGVFMFFWDFVPGGALAPRPPL